VYYECGVNHIIVKLLFHHTRKCWRWNNVGT